MSYTDLMNVLFLSFGIFIPIFTAICTGFVFARMLIKKHHPVLGIIGGSIISPLPILLLALIAYFYIDGRINEIELAHDRLRNIYFESWALAWGAVQVLAIIDISTAFIINLVVSFAFLNISNENS